MRDIYKGVKALKTLGFVIILNGRFLISNIILIYEIFIY